MHELRTGPDMLELNPSLIAGQLKGGSAYIDISWAQGPGPVPTNDSDEMTASDLSGLLKSAVERRSGELISRQITFQKRGKLWHLNVYLRDPVTEPLLKEVNLVLNSFRFD